MMIYTGLEKPVLGETRLPFELTGQDIVLVDDVLFTGRTVRAALDVIMDYGRPRSVKLAVLVDRGHRELPISADFTGRLLQTVKTDKVQVVLGKHSSEEDHVKLIPTDGETSESEGSAWATGCLRGGRYR